MKTWKWIAISLIALAGIVFALLQYQVIFQPTNEPTVPDTIKQIVVIDTIKSSDVEIENPTAYIVEWAAVKLSYFHNGNSWLSYDENKSRVFPSKKKAFEFKDHLNELAKQRNELVRFDGKLKIKVTKVE